MDKRHQTYRHLRYLGWELTFLCEHCGGEKHLTQPASTSKAQADEFIEKHKDCKKKDN